MQSPQSTKVRIPLFQHRSEIDHLWATIESQIITDLLLRVLCEIEKRLKQKSFDSSIDLMERKIKPQVKEKRTTAIESFFKIYPSGASSDSLVTHSNAIADNEFILLNLVQEAFYSLKEGDQKQMRKKSVQKRIVSQVMTTKDTYYTKLLFEKLNDKYQEVVKDLTLRKKSKTSRSFTSLPTIGSPISKHKKLREWDDKTVQLPASRSLSPYQEPRSTQHNNPFQDDDLWAEGIFSPRPQSPKSEDVVDFENLEEITLI